LSRWRIQLEGDPYDHETHQVIDDSEDKDKDANDDESNTATKQSVSKRRSRRSSSEESENSSDDDEDESGSKSDLPTEFFMGRHCRNRSSVFHEMSHWGEDFCRH
jgi:hypothetical protein